MIKLYSQYAPFSSFKEQLSVTPQAEFDTNYMRDRKLFQTKDDYERLVASLEHRQYHKRLLHSLYEKSKNVLVIAAGNGLAEHEFFSKYGKDRQIVLSDISIKMLEPLSEFYGIEVKRIDSRSICYPDNQFDLVYAFSAEYFFNDTEYLKMLSEMLRVTKPEGSVMFSSACTYGFGSRAFVKPYWALYKTATFCPIVYVLLNKIIRGRTVKWTGYRRTINEHCRIFSKLKDAKLAQMDFHWEGGLKDPRSVAFLLEKKL